MGDPDLPSSRTSSASGAGRSSGRPVLCRCLGDTDPAQFADQIWGQAPLYAQAADAAGFSDLLSPAGVDELLSTHGLRAPFVRVAKQGNVLPDKAFTGSGGVGAMIADQVRDDTLAKLFAEGHTIVLQGLHRIWAPLIEFATDLQAELSHPVQVNAYITPAQSQGFSAHYDTHDVFVLQFAGRKRWVIHEPVIDNPMSNQEWRARHDEVVEAAQQAPVLDIELAPGDALYLPRGYIHAAEALGELSGHLTVGIHPITRVQLLAALLDELKTASADDPQLRKNLPIGFDLSTESDLNETLPDLRSALGELANAASDNPDAVSRNLQRRQLQPNRPAPISPLAQAAAVHNVSIEDEVVRRGGLRLVWRAESHTLSSYNRTLTVPDNATAAIEEILDGKVIRVAEFPGLNAEEQVALARQLLTESIVVKRA